MSIKTILKYILIWQITMIAVISMAGLFLPLQLNFLGGQDHTTIDNPSPIRNNPILYSRANFDGSHYLEIARKGYGDLEQAFFPFYPNLIRFLTPYFGNSTLAGVIISTLSFTLGLIILYKLVKLDYPEHVAKLTLIAILTFPVSFFFSFVYTEGLFFLLVVGCFYAARRHNWFLAGILGGLASYTRFVGILLFPALLFEFWEKYKDIKNLKLKIKNLIPLLLIPMGLLVYMQFLQKTTGDPLAFIHVQKFFGQGRSDKIILFHQVVWRYLKMIYTVDRANPIYPTIMLEFLTGLIFAILSVYTFFKTRLSYAFFAITSFVIPTLTGTFTSLPRYVLVSFPAFIIIALSLNRVNKSVKIVILIISAIIQSIFLAMFVRGYWVA